MVAFRPKGEKHLFILKFACTRRIFVSHVPHFRFQSAELAYNYKRDYKNDYKRITNWLLRRLCAYAREQANEWIFLFCRLRKLIWYSSGNTLKYSSGKALEIYRKFTDFFILFFLFLYKYFRGRIISHILYNFYEFFSIY